MIIGVSRQVHVHIVIVISFKNLKPARLYNIKKMGFLSNVIHICVKFESGICGIFVSYQESF